MPLPFVITKSFCRQTVFCLAVWAAGLTGASAEMHLQQREMFSPAGDLTAEAPGNNFQEVRGILVGRPGGPHLANEPPASADLREQGLPAIGRFEIPSSPSKVFIGGWFFFKDVQGGQVDLLSLCDIHGNASPTLSITDGVLGGGIKYNSFYPANIEWKNRWIYLGIATHLKSGSTADVRFYCKLPGQPMQSWSPLNDVQTGIAEIGQMVAGSWTFGTLFKGRLGAASVYTFDNNDFSDIVYPADVIEPVTRLTWYCDPLNGDDSADGTSPMTAWKTAAKINLESNYAGMLSANSQESGDILVINTGGLPLDLDGQALSFSTNGLNVKAVEGQEWVRVKSYRSLPNPIWQVTSTPNVFSTTDTQADIVLWEDDKFMHHPMGGTFSAVAGQVSSTPGSFWTDGSTLYVHPFGSTDPRQDGKRYERSYRFVEGSAILLNAANLNIQDIHVGKTCLAEATNNDPIGGYCMGFTGTSGYTTVKHCYLYYGSKHNIGIVQGNAGDEVLLEDVQCEQGSPYANSGGQTLFVSFNHQPLDLNIRHRFIRCRSVANAGLIGSAAGTMTQSYPVFYSHNMGHPGEPSQFGAFEFIDCDFGIGNIQGLSVKRVRVEGTRCGSLSFESDVMADRCTFQGMNIATAGWRLTERNCVHEIRGELRRNPAAGYVDIQACTIDAREITGIQGGVPQSSLFTREGPLDLLFKNNLVLMPGDVPAANVFSNVRNTDSLQLDHNAYQLGGSTLFYRFQDGASIEDLNLVQWQERGQDLHSLTSASFSLNGLKPVPRSPLIDAGIDLGVMKDRSGRLFYCRNDMGAYEAPPATYESWMNEKFTLAELADPEVSGPETDYLADGQPNLLKYALGLEPSAVAHAPLQMMLATTAEQTPFLLAVSYERSIWPSDLSFELQISGDLAQWQTAEVVHQEVTSQAGDRELVQVVVRSPFLHAGFVKLQIMQVSSQP